MNVFTSGNFLLPQNVELNKWAVIACDQFTSEIEYWQRVTKAVGQAKSTLHLTLPEVYLKGDYSGKIAKINATMEEYLAQGIFQEYKNCFIYIERTLIDGQIRQGLLGVVDLECYDFAPKATSPIRATERTVLERIPPRKKIREQAALELGHVLLLADDRRDVIFAAVASIKAHLPKLYEFDLMEEGGHIAAWLIQNQDRDAVEAALQEYISGERSMYGEDAMLFAVGDGNHSLCTAKACYEADPNNLNRFAMVELENIHHNSQKFEPIHRLVIGTDTERLVAFLKQYEKKDGHVVEWISKDNQGTLYLDKQLGLLPLGILQEALDAYLAKYGGTLDYIHGDDTLRGLAQKDGCIGFLLPPITKNAFFPGIMADGVYPRKTFSMGHNREKRYYLEARKIR